MRQIARAAFDHALRECSIERALRRNLRCDSGQLYAGEKCYHLASFDRIAVVSIGKAGQSMAEALLRIVPAQMEGIIACPTEPSSRLPGFRYFMGGHPMPNEESLRAGDAILELLRGLPEGSLLLFLVSGGASAIAEQPIDLSLTLSDIIGTNRALVHSGAPIAEINAIRKHLSAIKGGRMAKAAKSAVQLSLLVSDVPDNAMDALASGPTLPDSTTIADCYAIAERYSLLPHLPERVRQVFENKCLQETPKPGDPEFRNSSYATVLSNRTALAAVREEMSSRGFTVDIDNSCDDWDYQPAADHLLTKLRNLRERDSPACIISGGEVTVKAGANPGVGGRNQQFALDCAQKIAGEDITVLSAGTDGIDGNSPAAGAIVDGTTISRAAEHGLAVSDALLRFDTFPLLHAVGDTIVIGPTGNNIRDLRILLAY